MRYLAIRPSAILFYIISFFINDYFFRLMKDYLKIINKRNIREFSVYLIPFEFVIILGALWKNGFLRKIYLVTKILIIYPTRTKGRSKKIIY